MSQKDSSSKQKIVPSGRRSRARMPAVTPADADAAKGQATTAPAGGNGDGEEIEVQDWKSRVIASYRGKSPKSTHTLLAKLSGDKAAVEVGERHKETAIQEAMISFVDRMFDSFQNCAYEINRHAAGSDLELNWIRPFLQKETIGGWRNKQPEVIEVLSGRLSTRLWTMVVRGVKQEISIHIMPTDRLISFGTNPDDFKVYLKILPLIDGLGVKWTIDETELAVEKYSDIYRELFESLIRYARGKAGVDETFNVKTVGLEPKKEAKVNPDDVQRQYQEAFFEDMRKRAENSTSELLAHNPQARRNVRSDGLNRPQLQGPPFVSGQFQPVRDPMQPQMPQQPQTQQQQPQQPQPQQQPPQQQPPYTPPVPPGYMPSPNSWHGQQMPQAPHMVQPGQPMYPQMPPGYPQPRNPQAPPAPPQNMQQPGMSQPMQQVPGMPHGQQTPMQQAPAPAHGQYAAANPNVSFPVALSMLIPTLDRELEVVAKAGMDAFSQRDLVRADAALKFSGRLSEFRALALELLDYYKRK